MAAATPWGWRAPPGSRYAIAAPACRPASRTRTVPRPAPGPTRRTRRPSRYSPGPGASVRRRPPRPSHPTVPGCSRRRTTHPVLPASRLGTAFRAAHAYRCQALAAAQPYIEVSDTLGRDHVGADLGPRVAAPRARDRQGAKELAVGRVIAPQFQARLARLFPGHPCGNGQAATAAASRAGAGRAGAGTVSQLRRAQQDPASAIPGRPGRVAVGQRDRVAVGRRGV